MSPLLQNLYAKRTGVDLAYVPFRVEEERLLEAVNGAYALNLLGLNVTVPHKQQVMKYLKEIDETAADIGAVNTLVRVEGGFKGYNTDVPGLLRAVKEAGIELKDRECILIGAGGAAKAAAYMMVKEGAAVIYLLNRSADRAESLAAWVNRLAGREAVKPMALSDYGSIPDGKYLAIQSTSVGMHPNTEEAPIEDPAFYGKISEAVDCIYTPAETKFMKYVRAAGGRAYNGLNMLLYQGVISYELWNPGICVDDETIGEARRKIWEHLKMQTPGERKAENLILIGFMGAGKTTVGKAFAGKHGRAFLDTDQLIEKKWGMTVSEIFASKGEEAFRRMETEILKELASEKEAGAGSSMVLSVGGGLPLRAENRELLRRLGRVFWLRVTPGTVLKRLEGDMTRPLLRGADARERVEDLLSARSPLYEQAAHCILSVDEKDILQIVAEINAELGIES